MSDGEAKLIRLDRNGDKAFVTVSLSGKECLWFAWAPENEPGPEGETVNNTYRPYAFDITGGVTVEIKAEASCRWEHHPGVQSGAGGANDVRGLENPAYQDARYRSAKIEPITARLNLLVAMQGFADPPTDPTYQEEVGLGRILPIGNGHTRLFLGFHDGRHWYNNGGTMQVTVTVNY